MKMTRSRYGSGYLSPECTGHETIRTFPYGFNGVLAILSWCLIVYSYGTAAGHSSAAMTLISQWSIANFCLFLFCIKILQVLKITIGYVETLEKGMMGTGSVWDA
jgi:hypothetical protein